MPEMGSTGYRTSFSLVALYTVFELYPAPIWPFPTSSLLVRPWRSGRCAAERKVGYQPSLVLLAVWGVVGVRFISPIPTINWPPCLRCSVS